MPETHDPKTYAVLDSLRNKKLIDGLEKAGGKVVKIPPAKITKIEMSEFGVPLEEIARFDWLIFADVYAAEFFLELLREQDFDLFELDDLRVCAFGEAVADCLRFARIHTDVIPVVNSTEKIVEAIENYIYDENALAGKRFLLLKEASEQFGLVGELEKRNAEVREAAIFRAEYPSPNELPKIKALVKGGAIDEIIFAAPEDFLHYRFLFRREPIAEILRGAKVSASDETTRQTLRENKVSAALFSRRR